MADNFDEDDELARVVDWIKANGLSLAIGAALGLAIIVGWQWWQARVDSRARTSARLYGSVIQQIERGAITDEVRATVQQLKSEYSDSPYAANAALRLAAHAVSQQRYDKALAQLDWVIEHSDSEPTRNLARVRKARVLWATGQADAALRLLDAQHPDSFDRLYAELAGDIHAALGERAAAHAAYQRAAAAADSGIGSATLQRKLARTASSDKQSVATSAMATQSTDEGA